MRSQSLEFVTTARRLLSRGFGSRVFSGFMTVAMLTVVAKGVAFLKDATVAHRFGTADALDAFMLAFTFLSFGACVLGGGLPEAFLPTYADLKHRRTPCRASRFGVQASMIQLGCLLVAAGLVWSTAPWIIRGTTHGFSLEKQALATTLLRQLTPFLVFFGLSHQLAIWLRADKKFAVSAGAPMLVPAGIISALVLAGPEPGVGSLVTGTIWGASAHLLVLGFTVRRQFGIDHAMPRRILRLWEPSNGTMLRRAGQFLIAGVVFSSASVVDQAMAAWLPSGSVAVLSYTEKICGIILALTAGPACDVLFPYFADAAARKDWPGLKRQLLESSGLILAGAVPAMVGLLFFAPWVVRALFERGQFGPEDTERVAHVLRFAALQIPFYIVGGLLSRVVVSLQASRAILAMSVTALILNVILNWVFMRSMGAAGIALSTVLVHLVVSATAGIYVFALIRRRIDESRERSGQP